MSMVERITRSFDRLRWRKLILIRNPQRLQFAVFIAYKSTLVTITVVLTVVQSHSSGYQPTHQRNNHNQGRQETAMDNGISRDDAFQFGSSDGQLIHCILN